jgi:hypothetical protein
MNIYQVSDLKNLVTEKPGREKPVFFLPGFSPDCSVFFSRLHTLTHDVQSVR